ncbi:TetR/AcrR family transcriptional regulator (plasmid) [Rhodococcus ruber]|uniref:TetR/AcrR family transcriptional regulator n=1 Tax=Rhodococcus ruber TaxID=1830 RepID=UPI00265876F4|nr:TetR/AcrR family transcriptional regulator [Rhodococcus ruber]WKK14869.1 TetR/AcrR family transcriptional regulator [Rhodococcus ruber]
MTRTPKISQPSAKRATRAHVDAGGEVARPVHGSGHARLRSAAEELLIERDGALDVVELAERAGASQSLMYRYYASKGALLAAVVDAFYDRYDEAVFDVPNEPGIDWAAGVRLRLERIVVFHYADPLAPVVFGRLARTPEVAAVDADRLARHVDAAAAQLRRGQRLGAMSPDVDAEIAGAMIIGGIHQVLSRVLARSPRPSRNRVARQLWQLSSSALGLATNEPPATT